MIQYVILFQVCQFNVSMCICVNAGAPYHGDDCINFFSPVSQYSGDD